MMKQWIIIILLLACPTVALCLCMPASFSILPASGLFMVVGVVIGSRVAARVLGLRRKLIQRDHDRATICKRCGYDMRGLLMPRCPECGTLRGFSVPLDELGVSEQEIRAGYEQRRNKNVTSQHDSQP